ncbi:hypothetical protein [Lentibacillus sp. CBA3610]|uniref:hypothetical protein n=1 Tax=Lentibacillus sp. CBA3610 TaxID=2518176 RepID=UPI001595B11A|nr:hypothetical protein [Lentibacillus sp. CBA3610]QKY70306.1 hypothetical protein Len3610_12515 [Lentibacillus sp. CBA3610]
MTKTKEPKLLFVSASGGHLEQLLMLKPLMQKYSSVVVTEKTEINNNDIDYFMLQAGAKQKPVLLRCLYLIIVFYLPKERLLIYKHGWNYRSP